MGKTQEYLEKEYGTELTSREAQYVLGAVVSITIAQNNPDRFMIEIFNLSANIAYVGFNSAVAIANGLLLAANGGRIGFTARDDGDLCTRQLFAIAAAGAPGIFVVETVIP